jgi:hypothetical protein
MTGGVIPRPLFSASLRISGGGTPIAASAILVRGARRPRTRIIILNHRQLRRIFSVRDPARRIETARLRLLAKAGAPLLQEFI